MNYSHRGSSTSFEALLLSPYFTSAGWNDSHNQVSEVPSFRWGNWNRGGFHFLPSDIEKIQIFGYQAHCSFHYIVSVLWIPGEIQCKSYTELISFTHIFIFKNGIENFMNVKAVFLLSVFFQSHSVPGTRTHTTCFWKREEKRRERIKKKIP